jgi:hypothetical protein
MQTPPVQFFLTSKNPPKVTFSPVSRTMLPAYTKRVTLAVIRFQMLELILLAHVVSDTFGRTPFNVGQWPVTPAD